MSLINDRVQQMQESIGEPSEYLHPVKETTLWEATQNLKLDVQTVIETKTDIRTTSELQDRMTQVEDAQTDIMRTLDMFMERIEDLERACEVMETDAGDLREIVEVLAQGHADLSKRLDEATTQ